MERKLIFEDTEKLNNSVRHIQQFVPYLNKVKEAFDKLEIGEFTNELHKEIINTGTTGIEEAYKTKIKTDIQKIGIASSLIKENLIQGSESVLNDFLENVKSLKRFFPQVYYSGDLSAVKVQYTSFENGSFIVSEEDKEVLLENHCRIYLETEDEHKLFNALNNLIESSLKVREFIDRPGSFYNPTLSKFDLISKLFLKEINGKTEVNPAGIKAVLNPLKK